MKDLGISDDSELDGYTDNNNNGNNSIRSDSDINIKYKKMDFPTFVKEIYSNCKNLGIPPTIIPSWIKDMFDFYLSYSDGKTDSLSDINIPFISQISFHIEQKKNECADLRRL